MDDVVRALREVALALLGADDVVRRRDEILERPGLPLVVPQRPKRLDLGQSVATLPSVSGPRLGPCPRLPSWSRTESSKPSTRSPRRSACARRAARRTWPSSWSTRAVASRPGSGTTWSCSIRASRRATPCESSAGSTSSATSSSSTCARSSPPKARIPPRSLPRCDETPTSSTASSSSWPARSRTRDCVRLPHVSWRTWTFEDSCETCPPRPTVITPTRAASSSTRSAWPRSAARRRSCTRACAATCS